MESVIGASYGSLYRACRVWHMNRIKWIANISNSWHTQSLIDTLSISYWLIETSQTSSSIHVQLISNVTRVFLSTHSPRFFYSIYLSVCVFSIFFSRWVLFQFFALLFCYWMCLRLPLLVSVRMRATDFIVKTKITRLAATASRSCHTLRYRDADK